MSETLSAFLRHYEKRTKAKAYDRAGDLFNEYCKANNIVFRDEIERLRVKRFFCLGFNIKDSMYEYEKR